MGTKGAVAAFKAVAGVQAARAWSGSGVPGSGECGCAALRSINMACHLCRPADGVPDVPRRPWGIGLAGAEDLFMAKFVGVQNTHELAAAIRFMVGARR